jgi:hypothetical protein
MIVCISFPFLKLTAWLVFSTTKWFEIEKSKHKFCSILLIGYALPSIPFHKKFIFNNPLLPCFLIVYYLNLSQFQDIIWKTFFISLTFFSSRGRKLLFLFHFKGTDIYDLTYFFSSYIRIKFVTSYEHAHIQFHSYLHIFN